MVLTCLFWKVTVMVTGYSNTAAALHTSYGSLRPLGFGLTTLSCLTLLLLEWLLCCFPAVSCLFPL